MSTIKEPIWKPLAIAFIILTIVFGTIAALAVYQATSLNNDKTNLESLYDHLKTTDNQNNQTITALNAKVSSLQTQLQANYTEVQTLNAQIATDNTLITHLQAELQANYTDVQSLTAQITQLQAKITALQGQISMDQQTITSLQNQVANLNAQVASLQASFVTGTYSWTTSCFFFCSATVTNVAYANAGTITANNAIMTATFYRGSTFLCSLQITLGGYGAGDGSGVVPGRTVNLLFGLSNSCGTGLTRADTTYVSFSWS